MKTYTKVFCIFSVLFLAGCNNHNDAELKENKDFFSILTDSLTIFNGVKEENIEGIVNGVNGSLKYHSIPKAIFFKALKKNIHNVRYFSRHIKLNENLSLGKRTGSYLDVNGNFGHIYLVDLKENTTHRARNFFLENKLGSYYIVKRIQFEDLETVIWNSEDGKEEIFLNGISVSTKEKDSLVFSSNSSGLLPGTVNPVFILKMRN